MYGMEYLCKYDVHGLVCKLTRPLYFPFFRFSSYMYIVDMKSWLVDTSLVFTGHVSRQLDQYK